MVDLQGIFINILYAIIIGVVLSVVMSLLMEYRSKKFIKRNIDISLINYQMDKIINDSLELNNDDKRIAFLSLYNNLESIMRNLFMDKYRDESLITIINSLIADGILNVEWNNLKEMRDIRNSMAHDIDVSMEEIDAGLKILSYYIVETEKIFISSKVSNILLDLNMLTNDIISDETYTVINYSRNIHKIKMDLINLWNDVNILTLVDKNYIDAFEKMRNILLSLTTNTYDIGKVSDNSFIYVEDFKNTKYKKNLITLLEKNLKDMNELYKLIKSTY